MGKVLGECVLRDDGNGDCIAGALGIANDLRSGLYIDCFGKIDRKLTVQRIRGQDCRYKSR